MHHYVHSYLHIQYTYKYLLIEIYCAGKLPGVINQCLLFCTLLTVNFIISH